MNNRPPIHKHGGASPNVEVPDKQSPINYKAFRAAYKATQERRAAAGKLVLPTRFGGSIK
jgi:hypothetical protein